MTSKLASTSLFTPRAAASWLLSLAALTACGSTPDIMEVELRSSPTGARVFIERRGESTYQGKVAFLKGNVKATPFVEDFQLVGTTPVTYSSQLSEMKTDATVLGVGGRVIRTYKEGVFRFERPGYETVEQFVRFDEGRVTFDVTLQPLPAASPAGEAAQEEPAP